VMMTSRCKRASFGNGVNGSLVVFMVVARLV
jgi:hypothetical protein